MSAQLPLRGVRVLELCWVWSGPLLGQLLADLGAEVIKVEWYKRFDLYRTRGVERLAGKFPEEMRREMSQSFHGLNRNKMGVTLDLKVADHRDAFLELASQSDMVIENFTAGTLNRLNIGYEALAEANPAIVLLSLAGFGATSRLGDMRAYGLALSALSGLETGILDPRDGSFLGSPTFVASDPNAASYGLITSIAAVLDARRYGKGAHVEISQLEAAGHISVADDELLRETALQLGLDPVLPADATVVMTASDSQYLCVDWQGRIDPDQLAALQAEVADLPCNIAKEKLEKAGCRTVRILEEAAKFGAGASDEGTLLSTIHPVSGEENIVAAPWWIDGARAPLRKTAPTLGEGNAYVLGRLLNWPPERYTALANAGASA